MTGLSVGAAGQLLVHRRVEQRGEGHGHRVGPERTEDGAPGHEEEEIAERAQQPDAGEAQQLVGRDFVTATVAAAPWDGARACARCREIVGGR